MAPSRAVVVAILAAASLGGWWMGHPDPAIRSRGPSVPVERVLDGDTIVVRRRDADVTVRLLGVDTPETHHPTKPVGCYGPEAAAFTTRVLTGRSVTLESDVVEHDVYGRTLATVWLEGRNFNNELLRAGYARLLVIPPNGAHAREQLGIELAARRARRGLWGACTPE